MIGSGNPSVTRCPVCDTCSVIHYSLLNQKPVVLIKLRMRPCVVSPIGRVETVEFTRRPEMKLTYEMGLIAALGKHARERLSR